MNLRTLKKLSKQAAPLLRALGDTRQQFKAGRGESYMGVFIRDRKHWERGSSAHGEVCRSRHAERKWKPRNAAGRKYPWAYMTHPSHPRKGTVMVGAMSGYYEPEWDEETAWEALERRVLDHFTDWNGTDLVPTRTFKTSGEILHAARELANADAGRPVTLCVGGA